MNNKIPLIIDTDPGVDDVMAISFALFSEKVDVKLITTVAGNVSLDVVTNNTLNLLNFLGKDIKVAKGAVKPLIEKFVDASSIHGTDMLVDYKPDSNSLLLENKAIAEIRNTILNSKDKVSILAIGPLTNIAMFITIYPELLERIDQLYIMGGSLTRGNKTPMAEFNIATDPEAAKIVFNSGIKITLAPLDVGWKALVKKEHLNTLKSMNRTGKMFYELLKQYRSGSIDEGFRMYDATALACIICPEMYQFQDTFADIETSGKYTRGMTIIDLRGRLKKEPNIRVCVEINSNKFNQWFLESLEKCV